MQDGAGLVVEGFLAVLTSISLQVVLVETVFADVIQPAVGTKHTAVPPHRPEQFGCRCAVGKQYKQRQKRTASGRCFLRLGSCHIAA